MADAAVGATGEPDADWQRRVVGRSLRSAAERSVDRGMSLITAAATVLERSSGADITVQEVADEAGQSLRTLYQYFASKDDLLLAVFEEAMRTYARMIRRAVEGIDDPLERLAGVILAAVRMPEVGGADLERGLSRLRMKLSEAGPERVAEAQSTVAALISETVEAAAGSGQISVSDVEAATFVLISLNSAYITAETLGNDAGVRRPEPIALTLFCLRGLGAEVDEPWLLAIESRLRFGRPGRSKAAAGAAKGPRAARAGSAKKA